MIALDRGTRQARVVGALLISALLVVLPRVVVAFPGDLDPSFGGVGFVIGTYGAGITDDYVLDVAVQSDGKIVAAGVARTPSSQVAVARYLPDGTPDPSFGSGGFIITPIGSTSFAQGVAIQTDGKIVLVGQSFNGSIRAALVVRYDTAGTLDPAFGSGGIVLLAAAGDDDLFAAVAIQGDGKIVAAGHTSIGVNYMMLVRLDTSGIPDPGFGTGGVVLATSGLTGAFGSDVALAAGGTIVLGGAMSNGTDSDLVVARFLADGSPDTTFGGDGFVSTDAGGDEGGETVAVQSDGRIVVAGGSQQMTAVRHLADGQLDPSFGSGGVAVTPSQTLLSIRDVALQADGKLVGAALSTDGFKVVRFNTDGSLDLGFACSGVAAGPPAPSVAEGITVHTDGSIVAGGTKRGANEDLAVARYQGGSPPVACGNGVLDAGEQCDDGNTADGDCCASSCRRQCGCRVAAKSLLLIKDNAVNDKDKLVWKWLKGDAATFAELGNPTTSGGYGLYIYDTAGPILDASVPPGPQWNLAGTSGYAYKEPIGTNSGVRKLLVKSGTAGKAKAILVGKGENLSDPTLGSIDFPLTVQLVNHDTGVCFESNFNATDVLTNESDQIKVKSP